VTEGTMEGRGEKRGSEWANLRASGELRGFTQERPHRRERKNLGGNRGEGEGKGCTSRVPYVEGRHDLIIQYSTRFFALNCGGTRKMDKRRPRRFVSNYKDRTWVVENGGDPQFLQ